MAFTKFATFEDAEVLDVKGSSTRQIVASLDRLSDFHDYRTDDGYMYVRIRAISSRVNKNNDGWPSIELAGGPDIFQRHAKESASGFTVEAADGNPEFGFRTFMGKPNFIDHNNSDPKRARGVVVDAKLRVLPLGKVAAAGDEYWTAGADPEHMPPTEVELLIEIDAKRFPKYAKAVRNGDIDGFSMGCDVEKSKCSHCGHVATNPDEYCSHIVMKGAHHDYKTADGQRISRKSYENCYGIHFFEISAVFDPADETALAREIRAGVSHEREANFMKGSPDPGDDAYFGGEAGSAKKAFESMREQYGDEKGEEVYYATRNKHKGKHKSGLTTCPQCDGKGTYQGSDGEMKDCEPCKGTGKKQSSTHTAEAPLPQSFELSAPEHVDTGRNEQECPECGSEMEGETCDVCGYIRPPKGYDNPDLTKARELQEAMQQGSEGQVQQDVAEAGGEAPGQPPAQGPAPTQRQPGSFLQTRNRGASASVMGDMRWQPKLNPKLAARIKQFEKPILPGSAPATNEPTDVTVVKSPQKPVTAAMHRAQDLIEANQGDTMSQKTADGPQPHGEGTGPQVRVDVTGVGGVVDATNEAASASNENRSTPANSGHAQVDVTGTGSTGVTDVDSAKSESLPTASEGSDDSGFDATKTTDDSGPTATYGDSDGTEKAFTDPVTTDAYPQDADVYKGGEYNSSVRHAYDAKPFYDQPGLSGGSANQGTQPSDPVGKAEDRVDVLSPAATPENNSGPTSQWTGTDGNGVERQQDPVTSDSMALGGGGVGTSSPNWTSHIVACFKLADQEVKLGLISEEEKYPRVTQLEAAADEVIEAEYRMLSRVKEAGTRKLAAQRQAGVTRLPGSFGRTTASQKIIAGDTQTEGEPQSEDTLDSALFSR